MTPQSSLDYFLGYLEVWRQRFGQLVIGYELTDFVLMGHSFGGYLACQYANKYPQHIKHLFLMSPIGGNGYDQIPYGSDASTAHTEKKNPCSDDFPISIRWGLNLVWKQRISPYDVARVCGDRFLKIIIDEYIEDRLSDAYARDVVAAYTFQIFMKKSSQEMSLLIMFDNQIHAYMPFDKNFKKMSNQEGTVPHPVTIVMGDDDWVLKADDGACPKLIQQLNKREGDNSSYHIMPGAGHNINLDNQRGLVNLVFNEVFGLKRPVIHPSHYS